MNIRKFLLYFTVCIPFIYHTGLYAQKEKRVEGIELTHVKLFESSSKAPDLKNRIYDTSFYQFASRYIYAELYVKNLKFNVSDQSYKVVWKWKSLDKKSEINGKIEAELNIKREWEYAYIQRGWGWENSGSWQPGEYLAEVYVDKIKLSEVKFTIIGIEVVPKSDYTDKNVQLVNQIKKSTAEGLFSIGLAHLYGGDGIDKDYGMAMSMFKNAFNNGSRLAAFYIGLMNYYGYGVNQDYTQAYNWFGQAPDSVPEANFYLGYMFLHGQYVSVDYKLADQFLKQAAEKGFTQAQAQLGLSYMLQASDPKQFIIDGYEKAYYWLYIAAAQNDPEGLRFLETMESFYPEEEKTEIEQKAINFLNTFEYNGSSYIHQAIIDQDLVKLRQLISYGVDIDNRENSYNMTPLHYAVTRNNIEILKYLIDEDAYINVMSFAGTPFQMASQYYNDTTIVSLLLKSGALLNVFDKNNKTALDRAMEANNDKVVDFLKKYRAKTSDELNILDYNSPLFIETFDDNSKEWFVSKTWEYFNARIENGFYHLDSKDELCSLSDINLPQNISGNYSVELKCIWIKGEINKYFGLVIGIDRSQYYTFGICASGWGTIYHRTDSISIETVLEWKENVALVSEGKTKNVIRIEVRGEKATYILNNNIVGTIDFKTNNLKMIGVRVCDFQEVAFDELKICKLTD